MFGTLGRVPRIGDRLQGGGAIFTVKEMVGRRVSCVEVDLHTLGDRRGAPREDGSERRAEEPGAR